VAGLTATYLGSHVLRHSNASRQIDLGADPRVVSDILGHRDPDSISAIAHSFHCNLRLGM